MYRDPYYAASCRDQADTADLPPELAKLSAQQLARLVAGVVGIAAFAGVVLCSTAGVWGGRSLASLRHLPFSASQIILLAWPAMVLCGVVTYWLRSLWPSRRADSSGDVLTAAMLEGANAATRTRVDRVARGEIRSFALLAAAVALLAPLTIHILFISLVNGTFRPHELDPYVAISLATVWLPHAVVGGLSWHFVVETRAQLDAGGAALHPPRPIISGVRAACLAAASTLLSAIFVACVAGGPYLLIVLVAGGLVVITGLTYLPLGFWLVLRQLRAERVALLRFVPTPAAVEVMLDPPCFSPSGREGPRFSPTLSPSTNAETTTPTAGR